MEYSNRGDVPVQKQTTAPGKVGRAFRAAFPHTLPIFAGFWFLGISYGIYMNVSGFSAWYPLLMSLTIFGGSLEFVAVSMLLGSFAPLQTLLLTLMIQARHLFYGLSMLEKFRGMGVRKLYMIFSLTDETYALLSSARVPERVDPHDYYFAVAVLDHCYWILGSVIGSVAGALIQFDTTGIDFAMTALFLVIAVDQWSTYRSHLPALLGAGITVTSLVVMGAANMLIPALCVIIAALLALRVRLDRDADAEKEAV